MIVLDQSC